MSEPGLLRGCYAALVSPCSVDIRPKARTKMCFTQPLNAIECGQVGHGAEDLRILGDACGMNTEDLKCVFSLLKYS